MGGGGGPTVSVRRVGRQNQAFTSRQSHFQCLCCSVHFVISPPLALHFPSPHCRHLPPLCPPPPAGLTSENVAAQYGVTRETQDAFAARSHALAAAAQAAGRFREEIVPVATVLKDPKTGEGLAGWRPGWAARWPARWPEGSAKLVEEIQQGGMGLTWQCAACKGIAPRD